jgi:hypothetical protein
MEDINQKYKELCVRLGDITVQMKGLKNQEKAIFDELDKLDEVAALIIAQNNAKKENKDETQGA